MSFLNIVRPDYLECGERARLIPVVADTSREGRLASAFLAAFMSVPEYAGCLMAEPGSRLGKTSKIECCTEVVFKGMKDAKCRPDGLIIITTGKKEWRALVEAKIGTAELQKEQIETYLDLAKQFNVDAVITISNQFSALPTHHPVAVNRIKCRNVQLYHWSWTYLMAEAIMWVKHHGISDPEQSYILEELVRYLDHSSSGVLSIDRMNKEWKDVCAAVQNGAPLNKTSADVSETVATWHQFIRNTSLKLSLAVGRTVILSLKKAYRDNAELRVQEDCQLLAQEKKLEAWFEVPNAASTLKLVADVQRRTVQASMSLRVPGDRPTAKGRVNWFLRQFDRAQESSLIVKAYWPGRAMETVATVAEIRAKGPEAIIPDTHRTLIPTGFEIVMIKDLAGRFRGAQTFIQDTEPLVAEFYREVGQHLREWVAPPPKLETPSQGSEVLPERLEIEMPETEPASAVPESPPEIPAEPLPIAQAG